jgi:hypothetical protein
MRQQEMFGFNSNVHRDSFFTSTAKSCASLALVRPMKNWHLRSGTSAIS